MRKIVIAVAATALAWTGAAQAAPSPAIVAAVANPARLDAERLRDKYRHPAETLDFFEVKPGQTVVELYPGGGWFLRILAPLLKGNGHYIAAVAPNAVAKTTDLLKANEAAFGPTKVVAFDAKTGNDLAPAGTVDRVLTFRNVHNLAEDGNADNFFKAAYRALKTGGMLGIEDHRLPEGADSAKEKDSGYLKVSTVYRMAQAAGFVLVGSSEINANPKDTADWPKGVWTLPPTLQLGEVDRDKYLAIGESDRMTLRFVKR